MTAMAEILKDGITVKDVLENLKRGRSSFSRGLLLLSGGQLSEGNSLRFIRRIWKRRRIV